MEMNELVPWLIGITLALWAIGIGLWLQGRYLVAVEREKEDKKLRRHRAKHIESVGIAYLSIGVIFLIFIIYLLFAVIK